MTVFAILYEEHGKPPELFIGSGAEDAARRRFGVARDHWSCHLMQEIEDASRPPVLIGGDTLPTTLAQFELRALRLLQDEQSKPNPDNALVAFLCDAVRLARENERMAKSPLPTKAEGS